MKLERPPSPKHRNGEVAAPTRLGGSAGQAAILDALPAHIALLDTQGLIVSVNEAWRRFGNVDAIQGPGHATGLNYLETCASASGWGSSAVREAAEGIRSVLDGRAAIFSTEYACHSPTRQRWFLMTVTPLAGDPPEGAVVMHVDVTADKQGEESLRESELRFRQLAENIRTVFYLSDPAGSRMLYVSPAYEEIWGRSVESLYADSRSWTESIVPEDRARVIAERFGEGASGSFHSEYRIGRADGTVRWIRSRGFPIRDEMGRVYRIAGMAEDITDMKRAEQELRESDRRYGDMLKNVHLAAVMLDRDATISYCNDYLLSLTGWRREEVIGRNWLELFLPPPLDEMKRIFSELLEDMPEAWHHENEILTRGGGRVLVRWNNTVLRSISGDVVGTASIGEDITEKVRLEKALRESEAGLRRAQELAQLAHVITRPDGSFESWSDTLPGLIGTDAETMPRSIREWMEIVHPDDRERYRAKMIAAGGCRERTEIECRVQGRDGERSMLQVIEPLPGSAGADGRMRWFSTLQDTTERKRAEAEVRSLNADLERRVAERTAELVAANMELEAFGYSISHDLRAPLNRIEGFSAMLAELYTDKLDARGKDLLLRIAQAGASMDHLVGDLFALSTVARGELRRTSVDVSALAKSIAATLGAAEPGREVRFVAPANLTARADPGLLRVVLQNLLGNAWKFTRRREHAVVEMGCLEGQGERVFFVRDNGAGFDGASSDKLFMPFQRLHAASDFEGTGIGLATVQRIVRRHGGRVWAVASVDHGATFFFTLLP